MEATCLLTDSMYALVVSDRGRIGRDVLDPGFAGMGEAAGGDDTTGVESVGRGGVSEVSTGTGAWVFGVGIGSGAGIGTSDCALPTSNVLASDSGASLSPDSADSWLVLRVGGVWRFCNTSVGGRSGNSDRSGTFSNGTGLPRKNRFRASKRALISAKMVSILAE